MADDPKKKPEAAPADKGAPNAGKKKKKQIMAGAAVGVIGLAFLASTLAAPKKAEYKVFEGPFVAPVSGESEFTANLADKARKRFLLLKLNAVYEAFDQNYVPQRQADPIYTALVSNAILDIASKYSEEVMNEEVGNNFLAELQQALDPVLFPVHVGKAPTPADQDPQSGLRMGTSADKSTLRGSLYDHKLTISAKDKKLRLDSGPPLTFQGSERDLRVESELGRNIFIDVTGLKENFEGQVMVGVYGRVRELLKEKFNVQ